MSASMLARAPRQSTILAAVAALHVGVFMVVASDRIEMRLETSYPPIFEYPPPLPEPERRPTPKVPRPEQIEPGQVERPIVEIPHMPNSSLSEIAPEGPVHFTEPAGSGPSVGDYRPPSIAMRGDRLAALISGCYPSAARRLGEEGNARIRIVVSAEGRAASWALAEGTGFSRLDSALDCVVRRLQFEPGRRDGRVVESEVRLPIVFRLH